jgi:hypothetical protein
LLSRAVKHGRVGYAIGPLLLPLPGIYPDWDALGAELARAYGAVFVSGGACYDST